MSFAIAQSGTGVTCQRVAVKPRNVIVAAHRPAVSERQQPSTLARIGGASLGVAAAALLMVCLEASRKRSATRRALCHHAAALRSSIIVNSSHKAVHCAGISSSCQGEGPGEPREGCTGGMWLLRQLLQAQGAKLICYFLTFSCNTYLHQRPHCS